MQRHSQQVFREYLWLKLVHPWWIMLLFMFVRKGLYLEHRGPILALYYCIANSYWGEYDRRGMLLPLPVYCAGGQLTGPFDVQASEPGDRRRPPPAGR